MIDNLIYSLGDNLYLNITNRCTNRCVFCIRNFTDKIGDKRLILNREPSSREVITSLKEINLAQFKEIVFCGFGEPLLRVEIVKTVAKYIKESNPNSFIRIDTNGHGNIFHGRNILPEISPYVDAISISLNAENDENYNKICRPIFRNAYNHLLDFIRQSSLYIKDVTLSVVNLPYVNIDKCKEIAEKLKVNFKIREFVKNL